MPALSPSAAGELGKICDTTVMSPGTPLLLHAWCTLCLISGAISLSIVGAALDEVVASLHFL
jgi:hypothetical protein